MENFEEQLRKDLHQFLLSMKEVDERMPECPDVEEKWEEIAKAYVPDGIREFQDYPSASLGWMMYIGMAVGTRSGKSIRRLKTSTPICATSGATTRWMNTSARRCCCCRA